MIHEKYLSSVILASSFSPPLSIFVDLQSSNASFFHWNLQGEFSQLQEVDQANNGVIENNNVWYKWNHQINKKFYIFKEKQG